MIANLGGQPGLAVLWVATRLARSPAAAARSRAQEHARAVAAISAERWTLGMHRMGRGLRQREEHPAVIDGVRSFRGRSMLVIPLRIIVNVNPIDEYFYRFGVAPHLDEPRIFDFTKMIVIADQNCICIEASCCMDDIR